MYNGGREAEGGVGKSHLVSQLGDQGIVRRLCSRLNSSKEPIDLAMLRSQHRGGGS